MTALPKDSRDTIVEIVSGGKISKNLIIRDTNYTNVMINKLVSVIRIRTDRLLMRVLESSMR